MVVESEDLYLVEVDVHALELKVGITSVSSRISISFAPVDQSFRDILS